MTDSSLDVSCEALQGEQKQQEQQHQSSEDKPPQHDSLSEQSITLELLEDDPAAPNEQGEKDAEKSPSRPKSHSPSRQRRSPKPRPQIPGKSTIRKSLSMTDDPLVARGLARTSSMRLRRVKSIDNDSPKMPPRLPSKSDRRTKLRMSHSFQSERILGTNSNRENDVGKDLGEDMSNLLDESLVLDRRDSEGGFSSDPTSGPFRTASEDSKDRARSPTNNAEHSPMAALSASRQRLQRAYSKSRLLVADVVEQQQPTDTRGKTKTKTKSVRRNKSSPEGIEKMAADHKAKTKNHFVLPDRRRRKPIKRSSSMSAASEEYFEKEEKEKGKPSKSKPARTASGDKLKEAKAYLAGTGENPLLRKKKKLGSQSRRAKTMQERTRSASPRTDTKKPASSPPPSSTTMAPTTITTTGTTTPIRKKRTMAKEHAKATAAMMTAVKAASVPPELVNNKQDASPSSRTRSPSPVPSSPNKSRESSPQQQKSKEKSKGSLSSWLPKKAAKLVGSGTSVAASAKAKESKEKLVKDKQKTKEKVMKDKSGKDNTKKTYKKLGNQFEKFSSSFSAFSHGMTGLWRDSKDEEDEGDNEEPKQDSLNLDDIRRLPNTEVVAEEDEASESEVEADMELDGSIDITKLPGESSRRKRKKKKKRREDRDGHMQNRSFGVRRLSSSFSKYEDEKAMRTQRKKSSRVATSSGDSSADDDRRVRRAKLKSSRTRPGEGDEEASKRRDHSRRRDPDAMKERQSRAKISSKDMDGSQKRTTKSRRTATSKSTSRERERGPRNSRRSKERESGRSKERESGRSKERVKEKEQYTPRRSDEQKETDGTATNQDPGALMPTSTSKRYEQNQQLDDSAKELVEYLRTAQNSFTAAADDDIRSSRDIASAAAAVASRKQQERQSEKKKKPMRDRSTGRQRERSQPSSRNQTRRRSHSARNEVAEKIKASEEITAINNKSFASFFSGVEGKPSSLSSTATTGTQQKKIDFSPLFPVKRETKETPAAHASTSDSVEPLNGPEPSISISAKLLEGKPSQNMPESISDKIMASQEELASDTPANEPAEKAKSMIADEKRVQVGAPEALEDNGREEDTTDQAETAVSSDAIFNSVGEEVEINRMKQIETDSYKSALPEEIVAQAMVVENADFTVLDSQAAAPSSVPKILPNVESKTIADTEIFERSSSGKAKTEAAEKVLATSPKMNEDISQKSPEFEVGTCSSSELKGNEKTETKEVAQESIEISKSDALDSDLIADALEFVEKGDEKLDRKSFLSEADDINSDCSDSSANESGENLTSTPKEPSQGMIGFSGSFSFLNDEMQHDASESNSSSEKETTTRQMPAPKTAVSVSVVSLDEQSKPVEEQSSFLDDTDDSEDSSDEEKPTTRKSFLESSSDDAEVITKSKLPGKRRSFLDSDSDSSDSAEQAKPKPLSKKKSFLDSDSESSDSDDGISGSKRFAFLGSDSDDSDDDSDNEQTKRGRDQKTDGALESPTKSQKMEDESMHVMDAFSRREGSLVVDDLLGFSQSEAQNSADSFGTGGIHSFPELKLDGPGDLPAFSAQKYQKLSSMHASMSALGHVSFTPRNFVQQKQGGKFDDYYELGELLGEGEFGEVFVGYQKQGNNKLGEERAIKIIDKDRMCAGDYEQVINEFNLLKGLTHPNLLTLYGFYEDEKHCYIVTDICKGGELWDELHARGKFEEADAAEFMVHLLSAVKFLQSHKIVHRDLNLENILLEENKELDHMKIIDFGLATKYEDGVKLTDLVGKPHYVAPEVLNQSYEGSKYDVWSVGVVCYILLSGFAPFEGDTDMQVMEQIMIGEVHFDDEAWDLVSNEAKDFVQHLLTYDEDSRPTAEQALKHAWIQNTIRATNESFMQSYGEASISVFENMQSFDTEASFKLKQAVYSYIASQLLRKEEKEEIDKVFRGMDADCDGKLSKLDIQDGYKRFFNKELSDSETDNLFRRINTSETGFIDYTEFVIAAMQKSKILDAAKLRTAFSSFDRGDKGYISANDLKLALTGVISTDDEGGTSSDDIIQQMIEQVDMEGDGKISFQNFADMMRFSASSAPAPTSPGGDNEGQAGEGAGKGKGLNYDWATASWIGSHHDSQSSHGSEGLSGKSLSKRGSKFQNSFGAIDEDDSDDEEEE